MYKKIKNKNKNKNKKTMQKSDMFKQKMSFGKRLKIR